MISQGGQGGCHSESGDIHPFGSRVNTVAESARSSRADWARYASDAEHARRDAQSPGDERREWGYAHAGETDAAPR